MSDTTNHYIGRSKLGGRDPWPNDFIVIACCAAILLVIAVCCGCTRKVYDRTETERTEQMIVTADSEANNETATEMHEATTHEIETIHDITTWWNDSMWANLRITEYGDDGSVVRMTEAEIHRGTNAGQREQENRSLSETSVKDSVASEKSASSSRLEANVSRDERSVRDVRRSTWLQRHWMSLIMLASMLTALFLVAYKYRARIKPWWLGLWRRILQLVHKP